MGNWSVEKKDIPKIAEFMPSLWQMVKAFWRTENANDEYWQELIAHGDSLCKQFGNDEFCKDMIIAVVNYFDKKARSERKK